MCCLLQVKLTHFYRNFCRHTVLFTRQEDAQLRAAVEATRTVHSVTVKSAADFVRHLRQLR